MAAPTYIASGTQVNGTTSAITPTWPSHQTNDVGILVVQSANQTITLADPQFFTEMAGSPLGTGTAGAAFANRLAVFWSLASTSNMSAPTIAATADHALARMFTVRSAYTRGTPLQSVATSIVATSESAVTIPAGTTPVNNCFLALLVANSNDTSASQLGGQTNGSVDNLTEVFDANTNNGVGGGICFTRASLNTAGAFSITTASLVSATPQITMAIAVFPTDAVFGTLPQRVNTLTISSLSVSPILVTPLAVT
jgi:hypothetical protein